MRSFHLNGPQGHPAAADPWRAQPPQSVTGTGVLYGDGGARARIVARRWPALRGRGSAGAWRARRGMPADEAWTLPRGRGAGRYDRGQVEVSVEQDDVGG